MSTDWKEISAPAAMQIQPLVSVQMLAYNHASFIAEAIDGVVMQQASFPIELIVGVDQSQDNTLEIVLRYQKRYPNIVRILAAETRLGMHKNDILTLGACRGKYLALCEGDDFWVHSQKLAKQIEILESDSGVAGCYHDCYFLDQASGTKRLHIGDRKIDRNANLASVIREKNILTCSMVFRNIIPAFELQKWLPRTLASDYMLALLVAQRGTWRYIDTAMAVYRSHSGGIWSGEGKVEQCQYTIEFMEMLIRSKEYSEVTRTIAARKRDAIRGLSIALATEGRLLKSCYQYLRSVGSRCALEGKFIGSYQYGRVIFRSIFARVGMEAPVTWFWKRVIRRKRSV